MRRSLILCALLSLSSCGILDYPMQVFDAETGRTIEVPLGDVIATSAEPVSESIETGVSAISGNGLIGAAFGAAAAALLGGAARSRKKITPQTEESATPT